MLRQKFFGQCLALVLIASGQANAQITTRQIAPGVTYQQEIREGGTPLVINILKINLNEPGVKLRYGQARNGFDLSAPAKGREQLHVMANREGAVAAINGDFADFTADPLGLAIQDGELFSETMDYRVCLGVQDKSILMDVLSTSGVLTIGGKQGFALNGVNRVPGQDEITVLTPRFVHSLPIKKAGVLIRVDNVELPLRVSKEMVGKVAVITPFESGESIPPCPPDSIEIVAMGDLGKNLGQITNRDDKVTVRFDLFSTPTEPDRGRYAFRGKRPSGAALIPKWDKIEQAIGGGPWLLRDGNIAVDTLAQRFSEGEKFAATRYPRTAAGVTKDGTLLLVTVDGRQAWSVGMSLDEMARLMKRLGAVNAINLDGGGSTSMIVQGGLVNAPSDGRLRPLCNGLLVFASVPETPADMSLHIEPFAPEPDGYVIPVSAKQTFHVADGSGKPISTPTVWGTEDGLGLITQAGTFLSFKPGKVRIFARVGSQQLAATVTVTGQAVPSVPEHPEQMPLQTNPPKKTP